MKKKWKQKFCNRTAQCVSAEISNAYSAMCPSDFCIALVHYKGVLVEIIKMVRVILPLFFFTLAWFAPSCLGKICYSSLPVSNSREHPAKSHLLKIPSLFHQQHKIGRCCCFYCGIGNSAGVSGYSLAAHIYTSKFLDWDSWGEAGSVAKLNYLVHIYLDCLSLVFVFGDCILETWCMNVILLGVYLVWQLWWRLCVGV